MNEFKINLPLTKAFARVDDETGQTKRYVGGLASGTNIDLEDERMAATAIIAFKRAIEDGMFLHDGQWSYIPLRTGHGEEWHEVLGYIMKAETDQLWNLYIEAELDPTSPIAMGLYEKLTRPVEQGKPLQLGLSIGGYVVSAGEEWDETLQRFVRVYYEVKLTEVSVVSRPANPITHIYAMAKSVDWNKVKGRTVLVSERDMKDTSLIENASAEETETVTKAEEVVAADATVVEDAEVVERSESVEESAEEEQVEKTDASDDAVLDIADEVEKAVEDAPAADGEGEGAEVSKDTDSMAALQAQMAELTKAFASVSEVVASLTKAETVEVTEVVVEKTVEIEEQVDETDAPIEKSVEDAASEEAIPAAEVEKGLQGDLAEVVKSAVAEAVATAIAPLQARIEELESEPVDKSISVRKAADLDPLELFKSEAQGLNGRDALRRAMVIARGADAEDGE